MTYQIHPKTKMGLVQLRVVNLQRSIDFYQTIVGLKLLKQEDYKAELTANGTDVLIVLEEDTHAAATPSRSTTGLYHFAILVPHRKALGLSLQNLIKHNIHIGQADHLVSEALYIKDPDNNGIEIYVDRPRDTWKRDPQGEYVMSADPLDLQSLLAEVGDENWSGLPSDTIIGHVHLHVADLEETKQFYCDILGFDTVAHYGDMALFVSAGGYHHHLGLNTWAGVGAPPPPDHAAGLIFYTIELPNHQVLESTLGRLRSHQISFTERDGAWFVTDPSQITIRFIVS